jgi:MFS superfamily sulfate permease-like transporter
LNKTSANRLSVLREVVAGATTASVALPLCVAAGVLAYSPLGSERVAEGAVVGLISAIVGGSIASVFRRSSFVTTIPTNPNALIQATLLGGLLTAFDGNSALALLVFAICATLAGVWQIVIGGTGLARILKLAPYPVIAGFVSGVGFLIVLSQLPLFIPHFALNTIANIAIDLPLLSRLSFGVLLVAGILVTSRRCPRVPALLAGLVVGSAIYHAMASLAPGVDLGPMIGEVDISGWTPVNIFEIGSLAAQIGNFDAWRILILGSFTLALVGTLDTVFALHAARKMADIEIDQNRDLVGQGAANVVTAAIGGLFVSTSLSLSSTNFQAGGRGRLSTLAIALVLLLGIVAAPHLIFALPRLVLAAILVVVGINVIDKWAMRMSVLALLGPASRERARARRSSVVVLAVALATILGQPIVGGAVGVALSCVVFMIEMNRPVVRRQDTVASLRSKRIRSAAQRRLLTERGIEVAVFELQGAVFFGNADELEMRIARLPAHVNLIVLDFRTVRNIDVSGAVVLQQIGNRLARQGKRLFLSGLSDLQALRAGAPANLVLNTFVDLDDALEQAEDDLIERMSGSAGSGPDMQLETSDFGLTMESGYLAVLISRMQGLVFAKADVLCRAGDPSDRLWLLTKGSVSVWDTAGERRHRIASIGPGCTVGEMGLLNARPRSAEVCADGDVHAYELTATSLDWILENHPDVGRAVLTSIARQLAERLRDATQELRLKASE